MTVAVVILSVLLLAAVVALWMKKQNECWREVAYAGIGNLIPNFVGRARSIVGTRRKSARRGGNIARKIVGGTHGKRAFERENR